ncbi:MAG: hypothetical protein GWN99_05540 [Gemmatimonadetes bacterium]|uniref:Cellulose biosynthesis protein BcsS n=1 Tax=Candidatus Kutchimonas denitrificans TaxID=3056748 RepID=A0AAE4ZDA7_9BACT|nr:hypothetical protein [Gemmatimonadota bacterium]NIR76150.1 hypothetical protein [Candidatus Kutchimonas denitrificans]NIS00529.1 hypothetical protein [Gemmatimonadota bacterium]NIT66187.1 hypothetical protein [Gemmatimonadota bacterium]NIU54265.1 hypothetical protein [Gemmatimonadota bacterium]
MRFSKILGLAILTLTATPAAGQYRVTDVQTYRFVSEYGNAAGLWVNPAASGYFNASLLGGHVAFDRPEDRSWKAGQYLIGLQWGPVGFGYGHDEYRDPGRAPQGDSYTLSVGLATRGNGFGVTRTWRTVGDADGSWDLGYLFVAPSGFSLGLTWRDIGSPVVRDTLLDERVVGAVTFREPETGRFSLSAQGDYRTTGDFRAFRIGGSWRVIPQLEFLALAEWNGDGDFESFRIGVNLHGTSTRATGVAGLESGGDVRSGSLGVSFLGRRGDR